jgi:hypothetical protein
VIANTELSDGYEEKVDSSGEPDFALHASNYFAEARRFAAALSTRQDTTCIDFQEYSKRRSQF